MVKKDFPKKLPSHVINIGGVPYLRKATLGSSEIYIARYDLNTERHLYINTYNEKHKRIELDDERLHLTEWKG